uniref:Uncharacterized protein n=1 Tax=Arundo donax TaxID=35708 RepID=A0A0A9A4B8_ARUDO
MLIYAFAIFNGAETGWFPINNIQIRGQILQNGRLYATLWERIRFIQEALQNGRPHIM